MTEDIQKRSDPSQSQSAATGVYPAVDSVAGLVRILDAYMEDLQAGRNPSREKLLADHPGLANQLAPCLAGLEFIHRAGSSGPASPERLGDFRIVREVGRGGMGVVYEAEQLSLRRRVALKILRTGGVADKEAMERFEREATTIASLHHTNIVPIYAIGSEADVQFYAMQFIEGESLAAKMNAAQQRGEILNERDVAEWGLQAAEALAHAHSRGVIHRDVKPSNLIVDQGGCLWLTDFGLAKRIDEVTLTITGAILGTPRYMSPEQAGALRLPIDHRTDIYSLGATLYELATGRALFDAQTPHDVLTHILETEPALPRSVNPSISRDLETIIQKCLSKSPQGRYATARDLADDLRAFQDGRPIRARRASVRERATRWIQRHRRPATAAAVAASIAIASLVGGFAGWRTYQKSLLGTLSIRSSAGAQLIADIEDAFGAVVQRNLAVPTQAPVEIFAGEHTLRLSASGLVSESCTLDVDRGKLAIANVGQDRRLLWSPIELAPYESPMVLPAQRGADILIVNRSPGRLRRIDGATGKPVWKQDVVFNATTAPAGVPSQEWFQLLDPPIGWPQRKHFFASVDPPFDLNGDGEPDIVLQSARSSTLLAISGNDGSAIWRYRARPELDSKIKDSMPGDPIRTSFSCVVGKPAVVDLDADGVADFVAIFASEGETYQAPGGAQSETGRQTWVEAVSGRTAKPLWRHRIADDAIDHQYLFFTSGTGIPDYHAGCRVEARQRPEGTALAVIVGTMCMFLEGPNGSEIQPGTQIDVAPGFSPFFARSGSEPGNTLILPQFSSGAATIWHRGSGYETSVGSGDVKSVTLTAKSMETGAELWSRDLGPLVVNRGGGTVDQGSVVDLDGDGVSELLLPLPARWDELNQRWYGETFGVQMLSAKTGEALWSKRLGLSRNDAQLQRMIAGPDLNGDGFAEVFCAAACRDKQSALPSLSVSALSGKDGRIVWSRIEAAGSASFDEPSNPLAWWQVDHNGWPMLVVPQFRGVGEQPATLILAADTGAIRHVIREVYDPIIADLNDDGLDDVLYTVAPQGSSRLIAIAGRTPAAKQRVGSWLPAQDFNGDGVVDFLVADYQSIEARSGADSKRLWKTPQLLGTARHDDLLALPPPYGDLDGDGIPDVVFIDTAYRRSGPATMSSYCVIAALSGRTGARLWATDDIGYSGGSSGGTIGDYRYNLPHLTWADLDGDGRAEVFFAQANPNDANSLTVVNSDGRLRFRIPLSRYAAAELCASSPPKLADLNGDGSSDLVFWTPKGGAPDAQFGPVELRAYSGIDGAQLWNAPALSDGDWKALSPIVEVGDINGDGRVEVIALAHHPVSEPHYHYRCEIAAIAGASGQVLWSRSWKAGNTSALPPLLADLDGKRRKSIIIEVEGELSEVARPDAPAALGSDTRSPVANNNEIQMSKRVVILDGDGDGALRSQFHISNAGVSFAETLGWRHVFDVDGDGKDELLYRNGGKLNVRNGQGKVCWTWPAHGPSASGAASLGSGAVLGLKQTGDRGPCLMIVDGQSVYGLDGASGKPRWRCAFPGVDHSMPLSKSVVLVAPAKHEDAPRLWFHDPYYQNRTVVHQALPADASGRYARPKPKPFEFAERVDADFVASRPLPWAQEETLALTGGISFLALVLPLWIVRAAIRRQSIALGAMAVAYGVASILVPFPQLVTSAIAFVVPLTIAIWSFRSGSPRLFALAVFFAALLTIPWTVWISAEPFRSDAWGRVGWINELLFEPAIISIVGIPGVVFWVALASAIRSGRRRRIAVLLASSLVISISLTSYVIWLNGYDPSYPYSMDRWYLVGFYGAFFTGFGLTVATMVRWIRDAARRWRGAYQTSQEASA